MLQLSGLHNLEKKLAVVEKETLGGICLNWGCIPTKTLISASSFSGICTGQNSLELSAN